MSHEGGPAKVLEGDNRPRPPDNRLGYQVGPIALGTFSVGADGRVIQFCFIFFVSFRFILFLFILVLPQRMGEESLPRVNDHITAVTNRDVFMFLVFFNILPRSSKA